MDTRTMAAQNNVEHAPGIPSRLKDNDDDVCNSLCGILQEGIDIHRCQAAQALGHIGGDAAIEALIGSLLDEDEDVRTDAATALIRIGSPAADTQFLENLVGDPCPEVKLAAITALTATRNAEVVPWLLKILGGRDEEINWDEEEFYANGWDDWLDIQLRAMESLADLGIKDAVPGIVAAIADDDALDIIDVGMKSLARIGPSGVTALSVFLDDMDERRRRRAAYALSRCDDPQATAAVRRAIQDPSIEVRLAVAKGLSEINPADERLAVLLLDEIPRVRAETVRLCGAHHAERLDLLLDDKDMDVRLAVLELLADHPELKKIASLTERLRSLLNATSTPVAAAATVALATVAPKIALLELVTILDDDHCPVEIRQAAIRGLQMIGDDEALQALSGVLDCGDRQIRLEAMAAISQLAKGADWPNAAGDMMLAALGGDLVAAPEPVEETQEEQKAEPVVEEETEEEAPEDDAFPSSTLDAIVGGLKSEGKVAPVDDVELSPEDIEFLSLTTGKEKGRKTIPVVPDVVAHDDVRLFAARLLGDFPQHDAARALLEPFTGDNMELKLTAADSLARIAGSLAELPEDVLEAMLAEVACQSRDIRLQVVRALAGAKETQSVMALINALDDGDSFVRTEAIRSLGHLGEAGAGVSRFLEDPDPSVRLAAAEAVAATNGSGAVKTLVDFSYSFEGYHGRKAARLLVGVDIKAANQLFLETLGDEDRKRYWKVAIEALEELNRT